MSDRSRTVAWWLTSCAVLTASMIVLGGLTRLTRAGLSITTWDPILGALPPLGDEAWRDAFSRYASSPEGRARAAEIDLAAFRHIYWIEWGHRLLGRALALGLLGPMGVLAIRRRLPRVVAVRVGGVLLLGFGQGFLGWFMVRSGLVDTPHVSPYRLAAHFVVGVLLFVALLWSALDAHGRGPAPPAASTTDLKVAAGAASVMVFALLVWGALMAGHHAGLVFPDFPTMGGHLVPRDLVDRPFSPQNLVGDAVTVHFIHRALALALVVAVAVLVARALRRRTERRVRLLAILFGFAVAVQVTLGAATVLEHVPIVLASLHQAGAVAVVAALTALLRELRGVADYAAL